MNSQKILRLVFAVSCLLSVAVLVVSLVLQPAAVTAPAIIAVFTFFALFCFIHPFLTKFSFTAWVFVSVAVALNYPAAFGTWFGVDLRVLIVPLIQIIMFGMGTTLNVKDFTRVFVMPWPVFIGFFMQFTVMPLTGFGLAMLFDFDPEVAAGIILVGSCPGGVASNLMTFLAGGNVALSVTMTSCSTVISPVMTPFLMKTLAGTLVPINFVAMMLSILNMIIVPIVAGLLANRILYSKKDYYQKAKILVPLTLCTITAAVVLIAARHLSFGVFAPVKSGVILGLLLIGVIAGAKLIINIWLKGPETWMNKTLPIVSMAGIVYIIGIITARSSEKLLSVGLALIVVVIVHNFIGYILGYWIARLVRLDESSCRTVAIEVGLQNAGMASGLAMSVLKSASTALAPAIFGPWMNVSGSMLATWWQRKPVKDGTQQDPETEKVNE